MQPRRDAAVRCSALQTPSQWGHADATAWLEHQRGRLLPLPYYLVTFTVPQQLRPIFRANQKLLYDLLLRHSAGALLDVGREHKDLGAQLGVLAVLQSWTRDLRFHPHVHCVVPGGGLSADGLRWVRPKHPDFFLPQAALAMRLRTRLKLAMQKDHPRLFVQIPRPVWSIDWVADVRAVGRGESALKYLAAYLYRTAFSAQRILHDDGQRITFSYRHRSGQTRSVCWLAERFLVSSIAFSNTSCLRAFNACATSAGSAPPPRAPGNASSRCWIGIHRP